MKVRSDVANVGNQNVERLLTYVNGRWGADRVGAMVRVPPDLKTFICGSVTRAEIACAFRLALFDRYVARSEFGFLPTQRAIGAGKRVRLDLIEVESLIPPIEGSEFEYGQIFWRFLSSIGFRLSRDSVSDAPKSLKARYRIIWQQQCFAWFLVNVRSGGTHAQMTGRKAGDDPVVQKQPTAAIYETSLTHLHELGVLPVEDAEYLLHAVLELLASPPGSFSAGCGKQPCVESATIAERAYEITNVAGDVLDTRVPDYQVESLDEFRSLSGSMHAWTPRGEC